MDIFIFQIWLETLALFHADLMLLKSYSKLLARVHHRSNLIRYSMLGICGRAKLFKKSMESMNIIGNFLIVIRRHH